MVWALALVVLGLVALGARISFSRWFEVCVVEVAEGNATLVRGRAPASLFGEIQEVARRAAVERACIVIQRERGHARVVAEGLDDGVLQQMRNVVGRYPLQKILAGGLGK